jgi:hypothetical protein
MRSLGLGRTVLVVLGVAVVHFAISLLSFFALLGMALGAASSQRHTPNFGDALGNLFWVLSFPGWVVINRAGGVDLPHGVFLAILFLNSLLWSVVLVALWRWAARRRGPRRDAGVL